MASATLSRRPTTASSIHASDGTDSLSKRPSRVINVDKRTTLLCEHIEVASILLPPTQPAPKRAKASSVSSSTGSGGGGWKASLANSFKVKAMPEAGHPSRPNSIPIAAKPKADLVSASSAPANPCPALTDALTHRCSKVNFAPLPPAPERGRSPSTQSYGVSNRGSMIRGQSAPPGGSSNLPGYNAQVARGGFSQLGGLSEADMITWKDLLRGTKKMCTKLAKGEVATGRERKGSKSDSEDDDGVDLSDDDDESDTESSNPKTPPQSVQAPTPATVKPQPILVTPVTCVAPPVVREVELEKQPEPTVVAPSLVPQAAPAPPVAAPTTSTAPIQVQKKFEPKLELPEPASNADQPARHRHRRSIDRSSIPPPIPIITERRGSLTKSMLAAM